MDKTSLEEINKGKRNFLFLVMAAAIIIGLIAGVFTINKSEALECSRDKDICIVEKTNLLGMKTKNDLIKMSDIAYVTYIPERVAGNMYASGYSTYFLAFYTKDKKSVKIFSIEYYEKEDLDIMKDKFTKLLKSSKNKFTLVQKL